MYAAPVFWVFVCVALAHARARVCVWFLGWQFLCVVLVCVVLVCVVLVSVVLVPVCVSPVVCVDLVHAAPAVAARESLVFICEAFVDAVPEFAVPVCVLPACVVLARVVRVCVQLMCVRALLVCAQYPRLTCELLQGNICQSHVTFTGLAYPHTVFRERRSKKTHKLCLHQSLRPRHKILRSA